uniref:BRCT domain-containing protein n=1 Tax=Scleropages formosus TaxID=113540 RepID=A0A8C9SAA6_SCLFO
MFVVCVCLRFRVLKEVARERLLLLLLSSLSSSLLLLLSSSSSSLLLLLSSSSSSLRLNDGCVCCPRSSRLMSDPVYLGTCEHMFCRRSCAGPCAGSGCIVCHSPAWVKDLQINRQLSNITQLFRQLEALLNPLQLSWVLACLKAECWTGEGDYEVGDGPARSRINRDDLLPPLFDGCFFFFLGSFRSPSKAELLELVKEGGGQVLARRPKPDSDVTQTLSAAAYHAPPGSDQALCTQYILYDPLGLYKPDRVRLGKVWSAPSTWLLECISAFQLLPVPEL